MICANCQSRMRHDDSQLWFKCTCGYQIYAKELISKEEILMGRDKDYPLDNEKLNNLSKLIHAMNMLRALYGKPMKVTSGYRPMAANLAAGGSKRSNHMVCLAVDVHDPNGDLRAFVLKHLDALKHLGLYCEDFRWTPTWVHFQVVPPASGRRIFVPDASEPKAPTAWSGSYDASKYDD